MAASGNPSEVQTTARTSPKVAIAACLCPKAIDAARFLHEPAISITPRIVARALDLGLRTMSQTLGRRGFEKFHAAQGILGVSGDQGRLLPPPESGSPTRC